MSLHPSLELPLPLALAIPTSSAHLLSALFASSYVGSIYLSNLFSRPTSPPSLSKLPTGSGTGSRSNASASPSLPPIAASDSSAEVVLPDDSPRPGERDHPATIRRRMTAVGLATAGSVGVVWAMVNQAGRYSLANSIIPTLRLLGIPTSPSSLPATSPSLPSIISSALPYLLAPTLLLGPLVAMYLDRSLPLQGASRKDSLWTRARSIFADWGLVEVRNYVVGPLTEELVFRSTILSVSLLARLPVRTLVFATPLWFGVAHAHHAWEMYRKNGGGKGAAMQAALGSAFQLTYTTLFGWFASYLYLRTGSVLPPLAAHVYCNLMGIYLPTTAVRRHPRYRGVIWAAYLAGITGFVAGLRQL